MKVTHEIVEFHYKYKIGQVVELYNGTIGKIAKIVLLTSNETEDTKKLLKTNEPLYAQLHYEFDYEDLDIFHENEVKYVYEKRNENV